MPKQSGIKGLVAFNLEGGILHLRCVACGYTKRLLSDVPIDISARIAIFKEGHKCPKVKHD